MPLLVVDLAHITNKNLQKVLWDAVASNTPPDIMFLHGAENNSTARVPICPQLFQKLPTFCEVPDELTRGRDRALFLGGVINAWDGEIFIASSQAGAYESKFFTQAVTPLKTDEQIEDAPWKNR